MGIKHLNKFLKKECKEAIEQIHLKSLSNKSVAIDISIYLYKFIAEGEESLIENLLTMLSLFQYYKITPIFVFDGEVPTEKKALLEKRKEDKKSAEKDYNLLKEMVETSSNEQRKEIQWQMEQLKKKFVYIRREQIEKVKKLFDAYGSKYIVAEGEADEMCACLVLRGDAWACLSEDMDMFVYGVPYILRYLSFINHNVVLYDLKKILNCLNMNQNELREICVLSGTDYNFQDQNIDINTETNYYDFYTVLGLFQNYRIQKQMNLEKVFSFYTWLKNTNVINDSVFEKISEIKKRFEINNQEKLYDYKLKQPNKFSKNHFIQENLIVLLKMNGFLF
jgi:flap endonuclease-1